MLDEETPNTPNGSRTSKVNALVPVAIAKEIKDVGKTMDKDKELFDSTLDSTKYTFTLFLSYIITN